MFAMSLLAFSSLMLLISGRIRRLDVFGRGCVQVRAGLQQLEKEKHAELLINYKHVQSGDREHSDREPEGLLPVGHQGPNPVSSAGRNRGR